MGRGARRGSKAGERRRAIREPLDQRIFSLDAASYDEFLRALDNPPAPGPKLLSLLRRVPAWRK